MILAHVSERLVSQDEKQILNFRSQKNKAPLIFIPEEGGKQCRPSKSLSSIGFLALVTSIINAVIQASNNINNNNNNRLLFWHITLSIHKIGCLLPSERVIHQSNFLRFKNSWSPLIPILITLLWNPKIGVFWKFQTLKIQIGWFLGISYQFQLFSWKK